MRHRQQICPSNRFVTATTIKSQSSSSLAHHLRHLLSLRAITVLYEAHQLACKPPIKRNRNSTDQQYWGGNYSDDAGQIAGEVYNPVLSSSTTLEPCDRRYQPEPRQICAQPAIPARLDEHARCGPPVGGLFNFKLSSWPHPWKFG